MTTPVAAPITVHLGLEVLLDLEQHYRPSRTAMDALRDYLRQQGAERTGQRGGTQTWCNGNYSADWAHEHWIGPKGHDIVLKFSGPNPVGPQQNGWSATGKCPEWTLRSVESCALEFERRLAEMREVRVESERRLARVAECCRGQNPQHTGTCGYTTEDAPRRLRQQVGFVRSWAALDPPDDLGNEEVRTALATYAARIAEVESEVAAAAALGNEPERYTGADRATLPSWELELRDGA